VSSEPQDESADAPDAKFLELFRLYGAFLRRTVAAVCRHNAGIPCEDIEQEARISLWKALQRERTIAYPRSYVYKVAVTAALRAIRLARSRREEALPEEHEPLGPSMSRRLATADNASPDALAQRAELRQRISDALATLAYNRRLAVQLHLQGLTTTEIAAVRGWTEPKARNLVSRGLKDLRDSLRALGIEYER
jgi:RNA polymerase sigma factor (sigma-70 family)